MPLTQDLHVRPASAGCRRACSIARTGIAIVVSVSDGAERKTAGAVDESIGPPNGEVETTFKFKFQGATVLDGGRGPILQDARGTVVFPDLFAADQ